MDVGGGIVSFILLIFALACFVIASIPIPGAPSRLVAWGLALLTGALVVARLGG